MNYRNKHKYEISDSFPKEQFRFTFLRMWPQLLKFGDGVLVSS